ncbi:MAG: hypothetical protein RIT45_1859 [Pseudomonadota bacterium]|jgi:glycerophosphoryl diester phosphodiesterase
MLNVAHRGARRLALENTIESLRIAYEEAADGVEFDVQLTADSEPVLFHDDTLEAFCGRRERVCDLPWRELRALELRDRNGFRGSMPHLDAAIELLEARGGFRNLELKVVAGTARRLADAVLRRLAPLPAQGWWVSSFDRVALEAFGAGMLEIPLGALIDDRGGDYAGLAQSGPRAMGAVADACRRVGPRLTAVHPFYGHVDDARMMLWAGAGMAVHTWTVNDPAGWRKMRAAGVAACITDDPVGLRDLREES